MRRLFATALLAATGLATAPLAGQQVFLPMKSGSVRFLVMGDAGTGGRFAVLLRGDGEKRGPFAVQPPGHAPGIEDLPSLD